jgi:2-polyprenyl-3-methyl-5-hydroxy-6-metoxy-1,4-benzoquinol methylase
MTYNKMQNPLGFYSASPLPDPAALSKFYAESYFQNAVSSTYSTSYDELELAYKRLKARALVELAFEHNPPANSFVDIGAGEGFLMKAAQTKGCDVQGADFSTYGVEKFHPELLDFLSAGDVFYFLDSCVAEKRQFAICSAINVVEHVIDPYRFMALLREIMAERGIALVTVPNDYSRLQMHLLENGEIDREFWFAPPQHLHYFNTETLATFCQSQGFKVLDMVADFPVDLFLLNPAANYIMKPDVGKHAHHARMNTDLLIIEHGYEKYLQYYRAMAAVGLGRDITVVLAAADA